MKNSRLVLLCLAVSLLVSATVYADYLQIDLNNTIKYSDNVFSLSDKDMDKFEDGNKKFSFIETSDDIIITESLKAEYRIFERVKIKGKKRKFSIRPFLQLNYSLYLKNKDKSRASFSAGTAFKTSKLYMAAKFCYYPEIYLRDYKDNDGTGEYEQYKYDKNLYKFSGNYRVTRKNRLYVSYKFEEFMHNEYFTEYDGNAYTVGGGLQHEFRVFYLKFMYYYKEYECDRLLATPSQTADGTIKDASYESNTYFGKITYKQVEFSHKKYIRPSFSFNFEDRFFNTEYKDNVHSDRNDKKYTVAAECDFILSKKLELELGYRHVYRDSESDYYPNIGDIKEYQENIISFSVDYSF